MSYFPFFVNVEKLSGVIIGGGSNALEKVERLLAFSANLTLIAKDICPEIRKYEDNMILIEKEYYICDLVKADYVIIATDDPVLNSRIYTDAKQLNKLVNTVDVAEKCDFIFPSVLKRGKLVVGVSTSGAGPQVAIRLRQNIENIIPADIEDILDYLAEERVRAKEEIKDPKARKQYLIKLADKLLNHEEWEE